MKMKEGLLLREIAGEYVVIAVGKPELNFNRMLVLNESGALLFRKLQGGASGRELVDALTREYEVTQEEAVRDVKIFLERLAQAGCMEP